MERLYKFNDFKLLEKEDIGSTKYINPKFVAMMNDLYSRLNDLIMPDLSSDFKITYIQGEKITISTGKDEDLSFEVNRTDDLLSIKVTPINDIEYEYSFSVSQNGIETIFETIEGEVSKASNDGIYVQGDVSTINNVGDDDIRPQRVRRSIKIEHIRTVLEDAFIMDDIDLKDIKIDELIRRMKLK